MCDIVRGCGAKQTAHFQGYRTSYTRSWGVCWGRWTEHLGILPRGCDKGSIEERCGTIIEGLETAHERAFGD